MHPALYNYTNLPIPSGLPSVMDLGGQGKIQLRTGALHKGKCMYRTTKLGLVALAAILLSNSAAIAAGDDFNNGVSLYQHGRYEAAMPYLERAAGNQGNATVHYYLADTYLRLGKTADALNEYNISYKLNPRSDVAGFCQQMIRTLSTYNPGRPNLPDPSQDKKTKQAALDPTKTIDPAKLVLPTIPEAPAITTMDVVRKWEYLERVKFSAQAQEQVKKAQIHLKTTKDLLKDAKKMASELTPTKRAWGESEKDFGARVDKGQNRKNTLMENYEKAVADAQGVLSEAKNVQSSCQRAASGADGPVPTTLVPYDGSVWSTGSNPFTDP